MAELLGREEFNRLTAGLTGYDSDSADVLRAEIATAQKQGDPRAEAAARRDLARVNPNANTGGTTVAANDLSSSLNQFSGFAPDVQAAILGTDQERTNAVNTANTALNASGQAQAESIRSGAQQDVIQTELQRRIMTSMGLDIDNPESMLNIELRRNAEARRQREDLDSQITDLESINFFQDPFGFLAAQPKLQALTAQYNKFARIENTSNAQIAEHQAEAHNLIIDTPAKNTAVIMQKAEADAKQVVAMAQAKAAELTAANASGHAKALMDAWTVQHQVLQSYMEMERLKDLQAERAANRAERAENAKDRAVLRGMQMEQMQEKQREKQRDQVLAAGINASLKMIGATGTVDADTLKNMSPQERALKLGVLSRGNFGNTYAEAIPFIEAFGNVANMQASPDMMTTIRNIQTRAQQEALNIRRTAAATGTPISEKDALPLAYQKIYKDDSTFAAAGAPKDGMSPASPYAIDFNAAAALAKQAPEALGIVGKVLSAAKDRTKGPTLNATYDANKLLQEVEARVSAGEASPKDAAEQLARFFATQSVASYRNNGAQYLGLPQVTDWSIQPSGVSSKQVDLMNPTQLEQYLTYQAASRKASLFNSSIYGSERGGLGSSLNPDTTIETMQKPKGKK